MNEIGETYIYLICLDQGIMLCSQKEGAFVLPEIRLKGFYTSKEKLKKALVQEIRFKIRRNNLAFLRSFQNENSSFWSLVIEIKDGHNASILSGPAFKNMKALKFGGHQAAAWDPGSKMAINALQWNPNYKDAFFFLRKEKVLITSDEAKAAVASITDKITNLWQSDSPDVVVETTDKIVGIECFQIDASGSDLHGSTGTRKQKEMEAKLSEGRDWEMTTVSGHISNSMQNLVNDFNRSLVTHLQRVGEYKRRLTSIDSQKPNILGFCVVDTTMFGSYFRTEKGVAPLHIFNTQEFWDWFIENECIDFFVFQQSDGQDKSTFIVLRNDYYALRSQGLIFQTKDIEGVFFNDPQLVGISATLPSDWR